MLRLYETSQDWTMDSRILQTECIRLPSNYTKLQGPRLNPDLGQLHCDILNTGKFVFVKIVFKQIYAYYAYF